LPYWGFSSSPTLREGSTPIPVHYLRRVLLSHALIPVREEDTRSRALNEHGHDRLREMLNAGKAGGHRMIPPQAKVPVGRDRQLQLQGKRTDPELPQPWCLRIHHDFFLTNLKVCQRQIKVTELGMDIGLL